MTPERLRFLRRFGALGLFAAVVFGISFMLSFPYERIKDQVVAIAASQNLEMDVGSTGPTMGIGVVMKDVLLRTRPELGKKPTVIPIERAKIEVSPIAQMKGEFAYSLALDAFDGQVLADVSFGPKQSSNKLITKEISTAGLPGVKEAINLPIGGKLDFSADLTMPSNRNAEAHGPVQWNWAGLTIGDGKEKLKIASNPLLAEGISLPRIRVGDFGGKIDFLKGSGKLQGVHAKSPDGEIFIEGELRLSDPLPYSFVDLYVRFKLSDALLKSSDKLGIILQLAESMGKRPDGFYGFRLTGTFGRMNGVQWMKTSPFPAGGPTTPPGRVTGSVRPAVPAPPALERAAVAEPPASPPPPAEPAAASDPPPNPPQLVDPRTVPNGIPHYATQAPRDDGPPSGD